MSKKKLLMPLAAFGLLFATVACGGGGGDKTSSKQGGGTTSQQQNTSSQQGGGGTSQQGGTSSQQGGTSSQQSVHVHDYEAVGTAVKNGDEKDVYLMKCKENDDQYIGIAFDDYSAASFNDEKLPDYTNVPQELRDSGHVLAKNSIISWKINVDKAISNANLMFGVNYTGSDHGSQSGLDGNTVKYSVKVNEGEFENWAVTSSDTYDGIGITQTTRNYIKFASINLEAGENIISLRQNNAGYRLIFGGEVRIHYTGDAVPVAAPSGYKITFTHTNCKVLVYESGEDYTVNPVEKDQTLSRDKLGNITKWIEPDTKTTNQPQVNFKVVCDEGYSCTFTNITITSVNGVEEAYKNLKQNPESEEGQDDIFRVTKIKDDLVISIVAVQGEQAPGHEVTFVTTNCHVVTYIGPKNDLGDNIDESEKIYGRSKDEPYGYSFTTPQVNFEVVCDEGYEFVPEIDENEKVTFITGDYKAFKDKGNNCYAITNIKEDLTVTITATEVAQQAAEQPVGAFRGLAKTSASTFIPFDLVLAADSAALDINGAAATVSSYEWDGVKNEISIVTDGAYGTITASFAENVFTITGFTGEAAAQLDLTFAVNLSGNCQFIDCGAMTLDQMNDTFVRRYDKNDNNGWQINKPSDGRISAVTQEGRAGLQCNGFSTGKVGFTLKNDLPTPIPGTAIKSVGCWIYNPGESSFQMKLFAYKSANRATNAQLNTFTIEPGWHFYQSGVVNGSNFLTTDSFYNFQFYYENISVNPVFDDLCIYM